MPAKLIPDEGRVRGMKFENLLETLGSNDASEIVLSRD
jgi:hypothetical protein